jgi:hypothetical protein
VNDKTALGNHISIAEDCQLGLAVGFKRLSEVNELCNGPAHRGEAPDNWVAGTAVQVMIDVLAAHGRCAGQAWPSPMAVNRPGEG